jgi:uncharacterized protein YndB with AHSA1/START domain
VTIERVFDAPRELVFQAWTKPEQIAHWWGPRGFTLPICEMEFRVGGKFRFVMRGPDGKDYPFEGAYLEIVEPERIVFQGVIHDEPGHQVWTTVTFADHAGKTNLPCNRRIRLNPMRRAVLRKAGDRRWTGLGNIWRERDGCGAVDNFGPKKRHSTLRAKASGSPANGAGAP